jgi:hypothetical protein
MKFDQPPQKQNDEKKGNSFLKRGKKLILGLGLVGMGLSASAKNENIAEKNLSDSVGDKTEKTITSPEKVTDQLRHDWNNYVDWLATKGMKGSPELDKNDLGGKMIDQYRAELKKQNRTTSVSREVIGSIQEEFSKYRGWSLEEIHAGRAAFADGANDDNYMRALSIIDKIPGQRTTSFKFPDMYLKHMDGITAKLENQGFAKVGKDFKKDSNTVNYQDIVKNK